MAAKNILPGAGHVYTSEDFISTSTVGADTLDLSHCKSFMVQIFHVSGTPAGDVIMTNTTSPSLGLYADLGNAIDVSVNGTISRFDESDGPFGICRIDATGITDGSIYLKVVGFD